MNSGFRSLIAAVGLCLLVAPVIAADAPEAASELHMRYPHYHVDLVVNDDGSSVETRSWSMTVLKPQALEWAKQASVSHSTSVQTVEVVEAYTRKADGKRIEVPKDNYQLSISKGRESGGPVFSDFSSVSVVFPDLQVGDTVVFGYRIRQSEPIFPGHYDAGETFSRQVAFDDVKVDLSYPAALPLRYAARDMQQQESAPASGRKAVQWRWSNPVPVRSKRRNFSVFDPDKEVGFDASTFPDHAAIAAAYGVRALPRAAVSERIRSLAAEIVGPRSDRREQARALHDWVSMNITYAGNCVGVGTVVPREIDFVLDNRMGDCKDHATLLQALLAARGIASQQALINSGSIYSLPRIPRVSNVNHVINYLPELDLFVDVTATGTPFGSMPMASRGKPVLLVGGGRADARVPVPAMASTQQTKSRLKIGGDGSLSGTIEVDYRGDVGAGMRAWARDLTPKQREETVRGMLRSLGLNGSGSIEFDDPTALIDSFRLKVRLDKVDKYVRFPGNGAFFLAPLVGGATVGRIASGEAGNEEDDDAQEGFCSNVTAVEEYTIELPRSMKISSLPANAAFANSVQKYKASYALKRNRLEVRRSLEDRTPIAVCPPSLLKEFRAMGEKVLDNLRAQVIYK